MYVRVEFEIRLGWHVKTSIKILDIPNVLVYPNSDKKSWKQF